MSAADDARRRDGRARRPPPPFRQVEVRGAHALGPHLVRVTVGGPELLGFAVAEPAASVRILLPEPGADALELPTWRGNEFVLADGRRPTIRTLTPRSVRAALLELDLDVVVHGQGAASGWARSARPGDPVAVSGPGRGYRVDVGAPAFFLGGDETALAAVGQLLEVLPRDRPVGVCIEITSPDARIALPAHPRSSVEWCTREPGSPPGSALEAAVRRAPLEPGTRVWMAGEASAVQRLRHHLFEVRGVPRAHASVRGYWKHGRSGDGGDTDGAG
jgi:NADPH-dependent ferric siderophore reductase